MTLQRKALVAKIIVLLGIIMTLIGLYMIVYAKTNIEPVEKESNIRVVTPMYEAVGTLFGLVGLISAGVGAHRLMKISAKETKRKRRRVAILAIPLLVTLFLPITAHAAVTLQTTACKKLHDNVGKLTAMTISGVFLILVIILLSTVLGTSSAGRVLGGMDAPLLLLFLVGIFSIIVMAVLASTVGSVFQVQSSWLTGQQSQVCQINIEALQNNFIVGWLFKLFGVSAYG